MLIKKYYDGDCVGYEEAPDVSAVEEKEDEQELDSGGDEEQGSVAQGAGDTAGDEDTGGETGESGEGTGDAGP